MRPQFGGTIFELRQLSAAEVFTRTRAGNRRNKIMIYHLEEKVYEGMLRSRNALFDDLIEARRERDEAQLKLNHVFRTNAAGSSITGHADAVKAIRRLNELVSQITDDSFWKAQAAPLDLVLMDAESRIRNPFTANEANDDRDIFINEKGEAIVSDSVPDALLLTDSEETRRSRLAEAEGLRTAASNRRRDQAVEAHTADFNAGAPDPPSWMFTRELPDSARELRKQQETPEDTEER
jgi:hypothetical protein